jgi:starch-binding outer membrane protein, SusD/RagB family
MKNLKTYLSLLGFAMVFAACESVVDVAPKDKMTTDVALSSLDGLESAVYGVYEKGRNNFESNDVCLYKVCQTDIVMAGSHIADQAIFRAILAMDYQFNGSHSGVTSIFDGYYIGINRANLMIEAADKVVFEQTDANIARKNRALGEALFFRAYYHHCLVTKWDNIELILEPNIDPNAEFVLEGPDEVYPAIISDLEEAIELLPEAAAINSVGRVSKGVARHLLSKVYMDRSEWAKAAALAEQVVNDPAYDLVTDLDAIFSIENQNSKEIIFSWQFSSSDNGHPQRVTQQWYPLYDRVEGVDRTLAQGGRPWARIHPNEYYWSLFEESDKRLEAWHMRRWYFDSQAELDARVEEPSNIQVGDLVTPENIGGAAGFGVLTIVPTTDKYKEDSDLLGKDVGAAEGFRNIIQYRVSEAYLIAAEAYWRAGDLNKGLGFINAVRARAGVSAFTTLTDNIILDEHARELGHEGHRWEMLKRMGLLVERVKAHNPDAGPNFQNFHTRWPLPRTFVDLSGVPQNEGYTE